MNYRCIIFCLSALVALLVSPIARADDTPDYNKQIAPLFTKYCTSCHNAADKEGKLVLESYAALALGGKRGSEIVPGHPEQSRLARVLSADGELAMPPKDNDKPKSEEIALIRRWIDAGAKGPQGAELDPTQLVTPKIAVTAPARQAINAVACSPDGQWIALARYGRVELLSADRKLVRELKDIRGSVSDLAFGADSKSVAAAAGEPGLFGEARLWNVEDGKLLQTFTGHRDSLYSVAISPDGKSLATGSYDQQIKLWSILTHAEIKTLIGHNGCIFGLAFHPHGKLLASASGDRTVKLWDVATGQRLETFGQPLQDQYTLAFSPDGHQLVAAGSDNRIRLWRVSASGKEGTNPIVVSRFAHEHPIVKLAYSQDGKTLASASEDGTVKLWDAEKLVEQRSLERQPDAVSALAFVPKSDLLLVGRADGALIAYLAANGERVTVDSRAGSPLPLGEGRVRAVNLPRRPSPRPSPRGRGSISTLRVASLFAAAALPLFDYADALAELSETEPNDSLTTANATTLPATIKGVLDKPGDADYFSFDAEAGQTLVFDVSARSIKSKAVPRLALYDSSGKLLDSESIVDTESDPLVAYTFPAAGRYFARVDDRLSGGSAEHKYRLSIGATPYVVGCFPLSVPANQATDVELIGFNLPPGAKAHVKATGPGEVVVPIDAAKFHTRKEIKILVGDLPQVAATEANDAPKRAMIIPAPGGVSGRIHARPAGHPPEANYYRFDSKAGQQWIIETAAASRGSPIDTRIDVLTADGKPIERVLLQAVRDSYINFRGFDSTTGQPRLKNWEEMELNQFVYMNGEVCKLFRAPQGPDSDFLVYKDLANRRRTYFNTTATTHANFEPAYIVEPLQPSAKAPDSGLPVFPIYYSNDDDSERKLGRDSQLLFTAPTNGSYLVRVIDVRGIGGERYVYRLTVREPKPDFSVTIAGDNPAVPAGSGRRFRVNADRMDYFDGDIRVDVSGLPPGFSITTPLIIQSGHLDASGVINALDGARATTEKNWAATKITAIARVNDREIAKPATNTLGQIKLADKPKFSAHLSPTDAKASAAPPAAELKLEFPPILEVVIAPGGGATCKLRIDRHGFAGRMEFDVDNLPHGVIVDNIGLSGILIPEGQTEQTIALSAASWVPETDRLFFATSKGEGDQATLPVMLRVRKAARLVNSESQR